MKHLKHACTPAPRLLWCCRSAARTTLTVLAYRLWHEPSVLLRGSFHQRSIKQTVTVSNWDLYSAEPEWFMHLSFLICWNKVSTFGFFFFFFCCMHQPSLRRWRGKDGANVLEEHSKVNPAICSRLVSFLKYVVVSVQWSRTIAFAGSTWALCCYSECTTCFY